MQAFLKENVAVIIYKYTCILSCQGSITLNLTAQKTTPLNLQDKQKKADGQYIHTWKSDNIHLQEFQSFLTKVLGSTFL